MRDTRGALSPLAANSLLVLAAVVGSLLLCELLLRLLGVSYPVLDWTDPVRGVAFIPGAKSAPRKDGGSTIEINSDGRRGPETTIARKPGTYRIALIGDSFVAGFDVRFEATAGEVLARRLTALRGSPVEVLNFGHGGYGTTQEYLTLKHEVWKYSPDLVLLGVTTGNDISDNYRALKRSDYIPYFVYQGDQLVLDTTFRKAPGYSSRTFWTRELLGVVQYSRLAQLINRSRHLQRRTERNQRNKGDDPEDEVGLRDEVQLPPSTPEWKEAWRVTEGVLVLMRDECRKHDTPFGVVTLTRGIQVSPSKEKKAEFLRQLGATDMFYPERRIAELGTREDIPVLNLAPPMGKEAEERQVYFHSFDGEMGVGHWNQEGNRAAGELIAAWVATQFMDRKTMEGQAPHAAR
jgi:hypothetical protein